MFVHISMSSTFLSCRTIELKPYLNPVSGYLLCLENANVCMELWYWTAEERFMMTHWGTYKIGLYKVSESDNAQAQC